MEVLLISLAYLSTAPKYPALHSLSSVYLTESPIMSRSPPPHESGEPSSRGIKRKSHDALDDADAAVLRTNSPGERSVTPDGLTAKDTASRKVNKRSRAGCLTCRKRRVGFISITLDFTADGRSNATRHALFAVDAGNERKPVIGRPQSRNRHDISTLELSRAVKNAGQEK